MKLLLVYLLAVTAAVAMAQGLVCPKNFCASQTCNASVTTENCAARRKVYKANATYCRCCAACLTPVSKGGICYSVALTGTPPIAECETGTSCILNTSDNSYTCQ
ncbi:fungal protease inhibitor-1-like [Diprion similis]|uniref:fungal protease inhibitor-1-like n=1 Tax=Diprion similis TaxID=362088 RepID=UPI001EF87C0C|nr:fungal protease inhibitor-1-like [Diprion similis]